MSFLHCADFPLQLEWLTSIPWPTEAQSSVAPKRTDKSFLTDARAQLDADHFGLEKVKKRLIEYLAVVRLRELGLYEQWEREKDIQAVGEEKKPLPVVKKPTKVKGPILLYVHPFPSVTRI